MKCNAKVIYYKGTKKIFCTFPPNKTDEEYSHFILQFTQKQLLKIDLFSSNGLLYECQGKVKMKVSAENEPYMGGSSAILEVSYMCDTCKNSYYPNLPAYESDLNVWINKILDDMK